MQAERLAKLLMRVLPGQESRARRRLAAVCREAARTADDGADERLELVAAVGERALDRSHGGIRAAELRVLAHVAGE